jgi:hypothetical protein
MIDLDGMKEKWSLQDVVIQMNVRDAESRAHRLMSFTGLHAAAWFVCIVALGRFLYAHIHEPHLVIAGAALDMYSIGSLIALIWQIVLVGRVDYGQPVTNIQKQLESVRLLRIRTTQWAVLVGFVVWAPFLMVVCQAWLRVDIYRVFGPAWVMINVLFGVALAPVAIMLSKYLGARIEGAPLVRQVMDDLAGKNLTDALAFLKMVSKFEA